MEVTVVKWGNSQGIRLPAHLLEHLHAAVGTKLNVTFEGEAVMLRPDPKQRHSLEDLVAGITPENRHNEIETGAAVGEEF
ncbi:hypothetical protein CAL26_19650 [Bordetella genomosp. 9]|uniref:SpoVT-AbrB domain-containing protein n=1 Tax=Bordetella genomosp. 9 TaxID=1416803 RepID=A0A261R4V4_9BORD|nr:AbrB/MazE/SpoVT family DNA-binding domain-containing protein [Bordetella genomosp. 9]OZI19787.1 hypothetical protein CAL26_19650 [Bordetella genomosp. 9]